MLNFSEPGTENMCMLHSMSPHKDKGNSNIRLS